MKEIESYNQRHIISFFLSALNNNLTFKTLFGRKPIYNDIVF